MALIVENGGTTGGVVNANTLVSQADVDAHALLIGNTAWGLLGVADREYAIFRAMQWFMQFDPRLKGCRTWPDTQYLSYPRSGVDAYGREIDHNEIPRELKMLLAEAAILESETKNALEPAQERNVKRIKRRLEGVGEKEIEYASPGKLGAISYPRIYNKLQPFLNGSHGQGTWAAW